MGERPLVVGLGGSTGTVSASGRLLTAGLAEAQALGARTEVFAGSDLARLPIYDASGASDGAAAAPLVEAVRAADAVLIATPGYHGGMSGLVKNAIDHLEALREDARPYLDGRPVGVIVSAAGWQAGGTTLVSVRSAVHALRGWPTPMGVVVNSAEPMLDAAGELDPRIAGGLRIMIGQLIDFVAWRAAARSE